MSIIIGRNFGEGEEGGGLKKRHIIKYYRVALHALVTTLNSSLAAKGYIKQSLVS